ncbi:MAG: 4-(cytidine 5'-diphospho)-2-C-methyl-D-erythritol kinase [Acidimicrobiales bacterium]
MSGSEEAGNSTTVTAPAKLTLSLRITGVRPDGLHELDAEMVTIDLADTLSFTEGSGLTVIDGVVGDLGVDALGDDNLVDRALALVHRRAAVRLTKRIPVGAGLGGGSADAAAVLRWAGEIDPEIGARLGSDVPFCVYGGRARVFGVGERIEALPFEDRRFVLLIPPIAMDTGAVYRAWDYLQRSDAGSEPTEERGPSSPNEASDAADTTESTNDLEKAALTVSPQLRYWRETFWSITGRQPHLAGSGSTWFIEGTREELQLGNRTSLVLGSQRAPLVSVRTTGALVPAASV